MASRKTITRMSATSEIRSNQRLPAGVMPFLYALGRVSQAAIGNFVRQAKLPNAMGRRNLVAMSTQFPEAMASRIPPDVKIAIVAARFNEAVVEELLRGCVERLKGFGIEGQRADVHRVPGAFELPLAAKVLAQTGRFAAIICLGAVIRGETPHFDYVAGEAARGVSAVALSEKLPVIFGVLTTNDEKQAWDRCGGKHGHAGVRAAEAAVEMICMIRGIEAGA